MKKKLSHEELVARLMDLSEKAKNATKRDTKRKPLAFPDKRRRQSPVHRAKGDLMSTTYKIAAALLAASALTTPVWAQETRPQIQAQVNSQITTNGKGAITGAILNTILKQHPEQHSVRGRPGGYAHGWKSAPLDKAWQRSFDFGEWGILQRRLQSKQ